MQQSHSHFNFNSLSDVPFQKWKEDKLSRIHNYNQLDPSTLFIEINDATNPAPIECDSILNECQNNSFCLYRLTNKSDNNKHNVHTLASSLGLSKLDKNICADPDQLTSITRTTHQNQHEYIPYSNKRLSWHTDGYYNAPKNNINSMLLHCVSAAKEGGESLLIDHELIYILLRDENPKFIEALTQADAMTIPANILDGKEIRSAQTGPVFSTNSQGQLHMRYSARKHNIIWKNDSDTLQAKEFIEALLSSSSEYIIRLSLKAGEGLICRNILHRRTSFVDYDEPNKKRLLYRGRYYDHLNTAPAKPSTNTYTL